MFNVPHADCKLCKRLKKGCPFNSRPEMVVTNCLYFDKGEVINETKINRATRET